MNQLKMIQGMTVKSMVSSGGMERVVQNRYSYKVLVMVETNDSMN